MKIKIIPSYINFVQKNKFFYVFHFYLNKLLKINLYHKIEYDINFMIGEYEGWILEGIVNEIILYLPKNITYTKTYNINCTKKSKKYFFVHYQMFHHFMVFGNTSINSSDCIIWFTHPNDFLNFKNKSLLYSLNKSKLILSTCTIWKNELIKNKILKPRIEVIIGGADEKMFYPYSNHLNEKVVLINTAFYERKNPHLILEVIKLNPDLRFYILGKNWNKFSLYNELIECNNVNYIETKYNNYPTYYSKAKVFLSLSELEGGPIPLIEALMSNQIPVCSNTGFANDVIQDGVNGFIIEKDSLNPQNISQKLYNAFELSFDNRNYAINNFTWEIFSNKIIYQIMK